MEKDSKKTTDFGYQEVPWEEKTHKVGQIFHRVAQKYDLMNDLMSLGIHRLWKRFAVDFCAVRPGETVLDLASGTGDLAFRMAPRVGAKGRIILADINESMLRIARDRFTDHGLVGNVSFLIANAEQLPLPENSVDCLTIAFGLRNVTDKHAALAQMFSVLKTGGRAIILEFSRPYSARVQKIYDAYSFGVLPKLGKWVLNDSDSYQYLAESIRKHPDQETLKSTMQQIGFARCDYYNLSGGIVAIHRGYKL